MTVIEFAPKPSEIIDFINDSIRNLSSGGYEAAFILIGVKAYSRLCEAMGERFRREAGSFETYQFIPIVVDPSRTDTLCVLPKPVAVTEGINWQLVKE